MNLNARDYNAYVHKMNILKEQSFNVRNEYLNSLRKALQDLYDDPTKDIYPIMNLFGGVLRMNMQIINQFKDPAIYQIYVGKILAKTISNFHIIDPDYHNSFIDFLRLNRAFRNFEPYARDQNVTLENPEPFDERLSRTELLKKYTDEYDNMVNELVDNFTELENTSDLSKRQTLIKNIVPKFVTLNTTHYKVRSLTAFTLYRPYTAPYEYFLFLINHPVDTFVDTLPDFFIDTSKTIHTDINNLIGNILDNTSSLIKTSPYIIGGVLLIIILYKLS